MIPLFKIIIKILSYALIFLFIIPILSVISLLLWNGYFIDEVIEIIIDKVSDI